MLKFSFFHVRTLVLFLCVLFVPLMVSATSVQYVEVEGKGSAETRAKAISEALVEAISQVNGLSLAAQDVVSLKVEISDLEANTDKANIVASSTTFEESVNKQIMSATQGLVQSYKVISEEPSTLHKGWVDVTVIATIPKYELSQQTQRKRIAVLPLRFSKNAQEYERKYAEIVAQGITNYLSQTRRFAVLDRDFLREKHAEFDLLQGDDVSTAEKARVGNTLGTDYIVVGVVDKLSGKLKEEKVPYTKDIQKTFNVDARMTWRIIEASTGMVMLSDTIIEKQNKKILDSDVDKELPGIHSLADATAHKIGKKIIATIYPLMVVSYSESSLTIGQGGETVAVGQRFNLIKYGDILIDPYTKEPIGREEQQVGIVEITNVLPKMSQAKVIESRITAEQFKPGFFILREVATIESEKKSKTSKTMKPKW